MTRIEQLVELTDGAVVDVLRATELSTPAARALLVAFDHWRGATIDLLAAIEAIHG